MAIQRLIYFFKKYLLYTIGYDNCVRDGRLLLVMIFY